MTTPADRTLRESVKESYGALARAKAASCCSGSTPKPEPEAKAAAGCCGGSAPEPRAATGCCGADSDAERYAQMIGYSEEELALIPEAANLGVGCGNPTAIASLKPGEVVVDLGSGAGMDAFLSAERVTETGRVIGVDMTPEMLKLARETAASRGMAHFVEFREGFIEALPIVSDSVDVVISNCVINLSTDKPQTFKEAHRVLKPGGRLAVSDICLSRPLPESILSMTDAYSACVSGALLADDYLSAIEAAGFVDVHWTRASADVMFEGACLDPIVKENFDAAAFNEIRGTVWSYRIEAKKPAQS